MQSLGLSFAHAIRGLLIKVIVSPGVLFLSRLFGGFGAKNKREKLAATYQNLLCADDHILRDIGMTRLDVMRLREDLFRK